MIKLIALCAGVSGALAAGLPAPLAAEPRAITVQSTTSTQNSGLFDGILPQFTQETGIPVRVVAVGTGQAIRNAANGDGDVLLVHAKPDEEAFVEAGFGLERRDVMYNDFVLVGPGDDSAGVRAAVDAPAALQAIAQAGAPFASRGDDSGTHKAERALWAAAGEEPGRAAQAWYRETGQGMGATLNIAAGMEAYALTDRATWIAFGNKGPLEIVFEGDPALFNQYGVILVNPERHPFVHAEEGQAFIDWLTGPRGQAAIAAFRANGEQVFFPNAG
ncbi:substrate-binding domain-containing protein [Profundibacterium mesophilum]|uniref:PBP superfamily domain containing protein n=1 Tax=Profundibacterium mesophilum KAUST100406-0324 TaxID=1037889 RepID=A0A921NXA2_9RHOB|nr:substrate-binding domain-containing protein [Profundibacterium mesophilum]KAF0677373.1 PBP superfamily domain containing protein [Profundibacterium mesophilum KAUST100406-0324]